MVGGRRANAILNVHGDECSTWLKFDEVEREALATHDSPNCSSWARTRS